MAVVLLGAPTTRADDKIDAIAREAIEKWNAVKSLKAKMTVRSEVARMGQVMRTNVTGSFELLRKGGKALYRQEHNATSMLDANGRKMTINARILTVYDGEYLYQHQVAEQLGQNMATKRKMDSGGMLAGGEQMFDILRSNFDLTAGADTKVNGDDCWVIDARPKMPNPQPGAPTVLTHYIRKKDGFEVKLVGVNADGKTVLETTYSDIHLNEPIDPSRFKFVPPEGVNVMDITSSPMPNGP